MGSTVDFSSIYGPAGGEAIANRASMAPPGLSAMTPDLPLGLAALVALGLMAWWALGKWD